MTVFTFNELMQFPISLKNISLYKFQYPWSMWEFIIQTVC